MELTTWMVSCHSISTSILVRPVSEKDTLALESTGNLEPISKFVTIILLNIPALLLSSTDDDVDMVGR